ncbi:Hemin import ATP-binding protein HmuV [Aquimixticola soesokkakensis]|uniref:Hemin import ATP-binding protein HmuV n=1 Tax=Aquimixticola soesokkakensis TaxID=1519096 RepID=A0A1Y5TC76_9RHOB|nr:heme ABC transporter ATP-binding protein [Aquimixticola soesokkakensis]SLN60313.1 Hemin import ATP-binding protein HmuV [Aquimixticola soesokkakensis]
MSETSITASKLRVRFGRHTALNGVDFSAQAGQLTAIVGPNGSGKTTLLRALTGDVAHSGKVWINGRETASLRPVELARLRAVLPQSGSVAFPFTVLELVRLGLTAGLATACPQAQATLPQAALARVGLAGFESRLVQDLSGGERQRVHLARVLVQIWEPVLEGAPRWLFLDEPVSALDIGHQLIVMQLAHDYAQAGGGVVAVMHDLNLTAMFADHVTLLGAGQVRASGAPQEVLTDRDLSACYGCALRTNTPPPFGGTWILPQATGQSPSQSAGLSLGQGSLS